jgi:hypothetical protein
MRSAVFFLIHLDDFDDATEVSYRTTARKRATWGGAAGEPKLRAREGMEQLLYNFRVR